jgi:hypothetical protein
MAKSIKPKPEEVELFNELIKTLVNKGQLKEFIAVKLGIKEKDETGDTTRLNRLCLGTSKTVEGKSVLEYIDLLYAIRDFKNLLPKRTTALSNFDTSEYEKIFFFYFWSYHSRAGVAVVGINQSNSSKSRFTYLIKDENGIYQKKEKGLSILSFRHENSLTIDIVVGDEKSSGSTYRQETDRRITPHFLLLLWRNAIQSTKFCRDWNH